MMDWSEMNISVPGRALRHARKDSKQIEARIAPAFSSVVDVSLLAGSVSYSTQLVRANTTDSGHTRELPAHILNKLDRFLISHRGANQYEGSFRAEPAGCSTGRGRHTDAGQLSSDINTTEQRHDGYA